MVRVTKLNVILDIEDESLQKYLNMGYNQVDPTTGKILKESIPTDVGVLRVAFVQHKKEIEELKAEIEKLKAKKSKKNSKASETTETTED